jgi:hypothetical protein
VDGGDEGGEARVALGEAARPGVAVAGVVAVGGDVDAVEDQQLLVVLLEEVTEVVGVLLAAERRVADAARGDADVLREVRAVHRVGVHLAGGALGVAQRGGVPTAAGVEHDVEGALVGRVEGGLAGGDGARATEGVGRCDCETGKGCKAEKLTTVHGHTSYSCKNL